MSYSMSHSRTRDSRRGDYSYHDQGGDDQGWTRASPGESSVVPAPLADRFSAFELVLRLVSAVPIPGPVVISGDREEIGQGSQFVVFKQFMMLSLPDGVVHSTVAVKQPKFSLDPARPLRLLDPASQRPLEHLCLEIKALCLPTLQRHPNIVRLLSWSTDSQSFHSPLALVMELASSDLGKLLSSEKGTLSSQQRHALCSDIAAGLDAIHKCQLVHGDLKPGNVLIFHYVDRPVAKLTDFGLSVGDIKHAPVRMGGTRGWQAPEVERELFLKPLECQKADNYSFGLVVWSTICRSGEKPPTLSLVDRKSWLVRELQAAKAQVVADVLSTIEPALHRLLHEDPDQRPSILEPLFNPDLCFDGLQASDMTSTKSYESGHYLGHTSSLFAFELPGLPDVFIPSLLATFRDEPDYGSPDILFAVFLNQTAWRRSGYEITDLLLKAASKGSRQAQEAVAAALQHYKPKAPSEAAPHIVVNYLQHAIASGSTLAQRYLENKDPAALAVGMREFRDHAGYGYYYTEPPSQQYGLHWLVSYGTAAQVEEWIRSTIAPELNQRIRDPDGATPLYLACARGAWDIAMLLLDSGANPRLTCTEFQISCLHWLFAFDAAHQRVVASRLVERGADLNALVSRPVPFAFYPFTLPRGTPLHWAVVTASHATIQVIIEFGADLTIRDGSDPYIEDYRVRVLTHFGGPHNTHYSLSSNETLGLSALDYAAMEHSPFIFELLSSSFTTLNQEIDLNSTDEEGFSVLHRLSASPVRYTRMGNCFSFRPFRGSPASLQIDLRRTVDAIKALGGDLEQLSQPSNAQDRQLGRLEGHKMLKQYTPLMLAALFGNTDLVRVLLEAGANVSTQNGHGMTALHCMVDREDDLVAIKEIVELLLKAGAAVGHADVNGNTALVRAAELKILEAMEVLLSYGADIEDMDKNPKSVTAGRTVFAIEAPLVDTFKDFRDETTDITVARLLEKYVLNHSDAQKKRRILARGSGRGATLLWVYARRAMRQSVGTLIAHGVDVNEMSRQQEQRFQNGRTERVSWSETALDAAIDAEETLLEDMRSNRRYSAPNFAIRIERAREVINAIKAAGGIKANRSEQVEVLG